MTPEAPEPTVDELDLGAIFSALAEPSRRKVIRDLLNEPVDTVRTCWSFDLPLAKSTLSRHFKVLRDAGLVSSADMGNRREVVLRKRDLDTRFPGLLDLVKSDHEEVQP